MFHSQKRQYVSRETLGGYSETVYRYMEGAGVLWRLEKDWEED